MHKSLPVYFLFLGAALCTPEQVQSENHDPGEALGLPQDEHVAMDKRSPHYSFGLGKRAYSYVSEYKRLPVYSFGLGKRSRPFSFGLGKRSVEEQPEEELNNDIDQAMLTELFDQYDDNEPGNEQVKRARPYRFGLGKRFSDDESEEKRARMYEFGLGKRARGYSFGLGKRLSSKFNFGIGKRQRDLHRFGFGLGKRSDGPADSDIYYDV